MTVRFADCILFSLLTTFSGFNPEVSAAEIEMPTIFGDSMVLQRDAPIHVWGWVHPGEKVRASIDENEANAIAGKDGRFDIDLPAMPHDNAAEHTLTVTAGDESVVFEDVLIGEVYLCSGQSNMSWPVNQAIDSDLEKLTAKFPHIRIISVPNVSAREPTHNFDGKWEPVTPQTIGDFSAVGYFFGRQVHQTINVPVGLIDNAWGGSAAEAWLPRETLAEDPMYDELIKKWETIEKTYDYEAILEKWRNDVAQRKADGQDKPLPRRPRNQLKLNKRPGNLYYGCLTPVIGFPIRGVIWYQGEANAGRAHQYRDLFPRLIKKWRQDWNDDFAFYWVQLADYRDEIDVPGDSAWAELREAQTMTLDLPRTGQAVIINLGESKDIHPKDKQNVGKRLARWTLAKDFGVDILCQSPTYKSSLIEGNKMLITFDSVGGRLVTFDVNEVLGFVITGEDEVFYEAKANIIDNDMVEVSSDRVANPVAVRYGWANNPILNLQSKEGLPATPFRTDQFKGVTEGVNQ